MVSPGVRFAVLGISIRTLMPKQHKLQKRLDERERPSVWVTLFTATVTPRRVEDMAK